MATFRIKHTRAGAFKQDQIVTDKQIKHSGADLDFWKQTGAVEEVQILTKADADENSVDESSYLPPVPPVSAASIAAQAAAAAAQVAATAAQQGAQAEVTAAAAKKAADKAAADAANQE